MWVEFVVGSRPCPEGFSPGSPVFLPPQKPTFSNSFWNQWTKSHSVEVPLQIPIYYLFIYLFILVAFRCINCNWQMPTLTSLLCRSNSRHRLSNLFLARLALLKSDCNWSLSLTTLLDENLWKTCEKPVKNHVTQKHPLKKHVNFARAKFCPKITKFSTCEKTCEF